MQEFGFESVWGLQDTEMRKEYQLEKKKLHKLDIKSYVLFGGLSEDFKPKRQDSQVILKGCSEEEGWGQGEQDTLAFLQGRPGSQNETIYHRLGLKPMCWDQNPAKEHKNMTVIKENQTSEVKKFSTFLCMGRCKIWVQRNHFFDLYLSYLGPVY